MAEHADMLPAFINDADPKVRACPKFITQMIHSRHPALAPLHRLMVFAQSIHVRRMIEGIALDPKQTFWIMTVNLLADTATVEWCKVFGSWDEDTHWTRVAPTEQHEDIRADLLKILGLSQGAWEEYRDSIVSYRDQMVAHRACQKFCV